MLRKRKVSSEKIARKEATKLQILEIAGKLIGKYGFSGCSIARITARAKIAYGAFYLSFDSQQDLFSQVLPTLGSRMLAYIAGAIKDVDNLRDLERKGLEANFDYLKRFPYMYRVLTETELYAPAAFHAYQDGLIATYAKSIRRCVQTGHAADVSDETLQIFSTMLIGARTHLLTRYCYSAGKIQPPSDEVRDAYLALVEKGLVGYLAERSEPQPA